MPHATNQAAIRLQIELLSYEITNAQTFDIHEVLATNGTLTYEQTAHLPASYLAALYPMDATYGVNYQHLVAFEAAFTRTLDAKIAAGYPVALAWLLDFVLLHEKLANARFYEQESHAYRHLVERYWNTTKPLQRIFGKRYKALVGHLTAYAETLDRQGSQTYLRLLRIPRYLGRNTSRYGDLMAAVTVALRDVHQLILQGDSCIEPRALNKVKREHERFLATLTTQV